MYVDYCAFTAPLHIYHCYVASSLVQTWRHIHTIYIPSTCLTITVASRILNAIHFPKHRHKYFRLSTETGGKYVGVGSTIRGSIMPDSWTNFLSHFVIWYLHISEPCLPQTFISVVEAPSYAVIRFNLPVTSSALIYFISNRAICRSVQNILLFWLLFANNRKL